MTKMELRSYRRQLEKMVRRLEKEDTDLRQDLAHESEPGSPGGAAEQQRSMEDIGRERSDDETALTLLDNEDELLSECRDAIKRSDRGLFGVCENCRKPISKLRLDAAPYVRYCIDCARTG
jgi:DnaK suppressor protein